MFDSTLCSRCFKPVMRLTPRSRTDHELNRLIREHEATAVIHTGDFGFINAESLDRMGDRLVGVFLSSPGLGDRKRRQLTPHQNPSSPSPVFTLDTPSYPYPTSLHTLFSRPGSTRQRLEQLLHPLPTLPIPPPDLWSNHFPCPRLHRLGIDRGCEGIGEV